MSDHPSVKKGNKSCSNIQTIGKYTWEEYGHLVESFHGHQAPGVLLGGIMADLAIRHMPPDILFDAICETANCLPDSIQLLTPCTVGNGWLKILNIGRYALTLYDKSEGLGIRIFLDSKKLESWPEIKTWIFKLRPKKEQDSKKLIEEIRKAGTSILGVQEITVKTELVAKKHKKGVLSCPVCNEAYPLEHGGICRACQGENPYEALAQSSPPEPPCLKSQPVEQAIGQKVIHDMTEIIPGQKKGAAFKKGQVISIGDICRLQQMGKQHVYLEEKETPGSEWIHEDDAALSFAKAMAGPGVTFNEEISEGKINLSAAIKGMLIADEVRLVAFNHIPNVMCASRRNYTLVGEGNLFAGTRAIPLYLSRFDFENAMRILEEGPLFRIVPLRQAKIGVLVTGTEIFLGITQDRFIPIITQKAHSLECSVVHSRIVSDNRKAIVEGIQDLLDHGADLIITTAGLSVDPDDVTRQGLIDAGVENMIYGAPIIPGAMTLLARLGNTPVFGVPACALYFKTTSLDLLLPRILAGISITRHDLSVMASGSFCLGCKTCSYPHCPFGK